MKLETEATETNPQNKISQPKEHRGKLCLWSDLNVDHLDEINSVWNSPGAVKELLARIFQIDINDEDPKVRILLDLYFYTLQFAGDNDFNREQTSAFFSMVKQTHEICTESPFENFDVCFRHFREQLLCHAVKRPPYSLDLYAPEQVRLISEYVINTYFRHYKMYKYAFTPMVKLDLTMHYTGLPITPAPSEAGDLAQTEEAEAAEAQDEEKTEEETEAQDEELEKPAEESEEAKQLRAMIKKHLEEEIKKLRLTMDEQLKTTEESLNQKLTTVEGSKAKPAKGGSAKGKKK